MHVEIKPSIGDDYPAVLRQMKAQQQRTHTDRFYQYKSWNSRFILFYDHFVASGATLDQVKTIFAEAYIDMVSLADLKLASADRHT
jgi:hypothetical protein